MLWDSRTDITMVGEVRLEGAKAPPQQQKSFLHSCSAIAVSHQCGLRLWTNYSIISCLSSDEADSTQQQVKSRVAGEAAKKNLWEQPTE